MRIVGIRERTVSIAAPIANAYIDFNAMTASLVAVVTDVVRGAFRSLATGSIPMGGMGKERSSANGSRLVFSAPLQIGC